jgi:hypothetical protein
MYHPTVPGTLRRRDRDQGEEWWEKKGRSSWVGLRELLRRCATVQRSKDLWADLPDGVRVYSCWSVRRRDRSIGRVPL